jgi:hypothetical protein
VTSAQSDPVMRSLVTPDPTLTNLWLKVGKRVG